LAHPTDDRDFRLPPSRARSLGCLWTWSGGRSEQESTTRPGRPVDEIVIHAADLGDARRARTGRGELAAREVVRAATSETIRIAFDEPIPSGRAILTLEWTGRMSAGLRGLYRAGDVAVTQFEAADARRVFPCFDEPGFKAAWTLAIDAPAGLALLSNAAAASAAQSDGRQRVTFRETPPLPTYLVALACGRLAPSDAISVRGVPVRTWAVPEKTALCAFGQEVAVEVLPRLEDYFGLPYAFGKLDQVGIPEFEAGAMENAGLVTFRETALLLDPALASLPVKKRVAEVVTHEIAHMWFGNWVTMRWWDDLWLNEAFATWMSFKIVDGWKPDWRVWLDFDAGKAAALHLDALRSTHPIRAEVKNPDDMTESFDLITYEKGGAVLRMIEGYREETSGRDPPDEPSRRANGGDDLWGALAEASRQPVIELANAWIDQPGHPIVEVRRDRGRVRLSQKRFLSEPRPAPGAEVTRAAPPGPGEIWPVPLVLRWEDEEGTKEQRHLLRGAEGEVVLAATGPIAWLCANAGSTGFYRAAYDGAGLTSLALHLGRLAPSERIGLHSDEWALVRAAMRGGAFLDLAAAFGAERITPS
jgi:puromycin-sensitive aminopeptidase